MGLCHILKYIHKLMKIDSISNELTPARSYVKLLLPTCELLWWMFYKSHYKHLLNLDVYLDTDEPLNPNSSKFLL